MIRDGSKTIEGRINDESRKKVVVGDQILFSCQGNDENIMCRVLERREFDSFESFLSPSEGGYNIEVVIPDLERDEGIKLYYEIYGEKIKKMSNQEKIVVGFTLEIIE